MIKIVLRNSGFNVSTIKSNEFIIELSVSFCSSNDAHLQLRSKWHRLFWSWLNRWILPQVRVWSALIGVHGRCFLQVTIYWLLFQFDLTNISFFSEILSVNKILDGILWTDLFYLHWSKSMVWHNLLRTWAHWKSCCQVIALRSWYHLHFLLGVYKEISVLRWDRMENFLLLLDLLVLIVTGTRVSILFQFCIADLFVRSRRLVQRTNIFVVCEAEMGSF